MSLGATEMPGSLETHLWNHWLELVMSNFKFGAEEKSFARVFSSAVELPVHLSGT